nr:hypothetical protein [bacterium]
MTVSAPQVRYTFEATYIDANGLEIPFRAEIQFTQHLNAGAMIAAVAYAPDGIVFKNDEVATLKAHCDLWRGATIDTDNVTYAWGIKDSAVFANTTLLQLQTLAQQQSLWHLLLIWRLAVRLLSALLNTLSPLSIPRQRLLR